MLLKSLSDFELYYYTSLAFKKLDFSCSRSSFLSTLCLLSSVQCCLAKSLDLADTFFNTFLSHAPVSQGNFELFSNRAELYVEHLIVCSKVTFPSLSMKLFPCPTSLGPSSVKWRFIRPEPHPAGAVHMLLGFHGCNFLVADKLCDCFRKLHWFHLLCVFYTIKIVDVCACSECSG